MIQISRVFYIYLGLVSFFFGSRVSLGAASAGSAVGSFDSAVRVFAVGSNQSFNRSLTPLKYAEADAIRFAEAMKTVGMVPILHAHTVTDGTREGFRNALRALGAASTKSTTTGKLIFYFSGHADTAGLHFSDGLVTRGELHDLLAKVQARTKIAVIDSCFSEAITAKGIERGPAFELPRAEYDEPSGTVFLTASSDKQFAFESPELKGSVFTHHLLAGLYGEADSNRDGIVTIDELYQFAYRRTRWQTLSMPGGMAQSPAYVANLKGQGAVALSFPAAANATLAIHPPIGGAIAFTSKEGIQIFRVEKLRGEIKQLQLPAATYLVTVMNEKGVADAELALLPGHTTILAETALIWRPNPDSRGDSKKGLSHDQSKVVTPTDTAIEFQAKPDRGNVWYGLHSGYLKDQTAFGPVIGYEREMTQRLPLAGGIHLQRNDGTRQGVRFTTTSGTAMIYSSFFPSQPRRGLRFAAAGGAGFAMHFQSIDRGESPEPQKEMGVTPQVAVRLGAEYFYREFDRGNQQEPGVWGLELRLDYIPMEANRYASGYGLALRTTL